MDNDNGAYSLTSNNENGTGKLPIPESNLQQRKYHIIIVEDEEMMMEMLSSEIKRSLSDKENYTIHEFPNGERALEAIKEMVERGDHIAVIITDQKMPLKTGAELISDINKLYPEITLRIIMHSGDIPAAITSQHETQKENAIVISHKIAKGGCSFIMVAATVKKILSEGNPN